MIANPFASRVARPSLNKENLSAQETLHENGPAEPISALEPLIPLTYHLSKHSALPKKTPRPRPPKRAQKKQKTTPARSNVNKPAKISLRSPADAKLATLARDIIASLSEESPSVSSAMTSSSSTAALPTITSEVLASVSAQLKGHNTQAHFQRVRFADI